MNLKNLVWCAVVILVLIPSCRKTSNNTMLQQKGKAQTEVLQLLQTIESIDGFGENYILVIKDFIAMAEKFSSNYPEDTMTQEFMYKAGLLAMTVAKTSENSEETSYYCQKALLIFEDIQKIYPDYNGIRNCILNKGIIYEDILIDYENAEISYREFIARFPLDTLSANLESYLPYLGKSPEEIITSFGKQ